MKSLNGVLSWLGCALTLVGPRAMAGDPITLPLWIPAPPGGVGSAGPETIDAAGTVGNVSTPSVAVYLPARALATGTALIVCPGGSYAKVGFFTTGMGTVDYFVPKGIGVIVLKYRTRPPSHESAVCSSPQAGAPVAQGSRRRR